VSGVPKTLRYGAIRHREAEILNNMCWQEGL
jgi:hypothetical protein